MIEKKPSYLAARRSHETNDPDLWDLAAAGLHKRQGQTETVKKLKHVIFEFNSKDRMCIVLDIFFDKENPANTNKDLREFMTKFNQLRGIVNLRMSKFVQATG